MRYLGIDYGLRYVGLALGDDETHMAIPYKTIDQTHEHILDALKQIIGEEGVCALVVGMPFHQGASREQEEHTREFIESVRQGLSLPIHEWNEQFTSQESQRRMKEGSTADEHSIAAMLILQSYLDYYTLTPNP